MGSCPDTDIDPESLYVLERRGPQTSLKFIFDKSRVLLYDSIF